MRYLLPLILCAALPGVALAEPKCEHSKPIAQELDLAGVNKVMFEVGAYDLEVNAAAGRQGSLAGRACASSADRLAQLEVVQVRDGDTLRVSLRRVAPRAELNFGRSYSGLYVTGTVPNDVLVQLKVGSGDASVTGPRSLSVDLGSGDVAAHDIAQRVTAAVGSGDLEINGAGALKVLSVGSGDIEARNIRGDVEVGSIGSGDLEVDGAAGNVSISSIGSGDASLRRIGGQVRVESIGSGNLDVRGARALTVGSVGSGDVRHRDVGQVSLPKAR